MVHLCCEIILMSSKHFLVRNRHSNVWYGRVVIPNALRPSFNGQGEIRRSLNTPDKRKAKFLSLELRVQCQKGFERLSLAANAHKNFQNSNAFLDWLSEDREQGYVQSMKKIIKVKDVLGNEFEIDTGDAQQDTDAAARLLEINKPLYEQFVAEYRKTNNKNTVHQYLHQAESYSRSTSQNTPETTMPFNEAADLYIDRLKTQGRKGRKLAQRTLLHYEAYLEFWKEYFEARPVHEITLTELGEIQDWLPWLQPNYKKKKDKRGNPIQTSVAIEKAKARINPEDRLSDKSVAEYLGQLKGFLEFCFNRGFLNTDLARYIELPNTKQSRKVARLPFDMDDLKKIFPGQDYGVDFGTQRGGIDHDCKFWFPLLAVFSGARLEELAQLKTSDIKTCPDTGIIYMMIDNQGVAGDGKAKRTKNLNSVRPIPIHSTLLDIGFMAFVAQRQKDKSDQSLFKLKRNKQGRLAKGLSNWFSRLDQRANGGEIKGYIEKRGVLGRGTGEDGQKWTKSFHSFRHTVIDNLRGKKMANGEYIREQDIALVVGHEKEKLETANYGANRTQLELRRDIVEAIHYEGVGFGEIGFG